MLSNLDKEFAKRIKTLRRGRGLKQTEAAHLIGISYSSLQNHEHGFWPRKNNFEKYLKFYKCNRNWLLTGEGEPFPPGEGSLNNGNIKNENKETAYEMASLKVTDFENMEEPIVHLDDMQGSKIPEPILMAAKIFDSGTFYGKFLYNIVKHFDRILQSYHDIAAIRKECEDLKNRLNECENKLAKIADEKTTT